MSNNKSYRFSEEKRKLLESFQHPLAAYQFENDKIVTLLVSDGMCHMCGMEREPLMKLFDTDMYRGTHPDDVERVAELAHRFIINENEYEVTYRTILYGKMEYRYLHAISKMHTMEDGSRVAFTMYDDVTDLIEKENENAKLVDEPIVKFLDENMGPMAVVERKTKKLLYYNKALTRMLPPRVKYDSGRTFQDFFYHGMTAPNGLPATIAGLFDIIDIGPTIMTEPLTERKIEVTASSSMWGDVPSYTLFFAEAVGEASDYSEEQEMRKQRQAFNRIINSVSATKNKYYEPGYKAYWIWNLTQDGQLVRDEGHEHIHEHIGQNFNYQQYWEYMYKLFDGKGNREFAETITLDGLKRMYLNGTNHLSTNFTAHNEYGQVTMHTELTMMQAPVTNDVYLKITEENITDIIVQKELLSTLTRKQFDYLLYLDGRANSCNIINGNTSNKTQAEQNGSLEVYYRQISEKLGVHCDSGKELVAYLEKKCGSQDQATYINQISEDSVKSIYIRALDKANKQYFVCSSDITDIIKREDDNKKELIKALEMAENANKAKVEFLSNVSHDMRTPLNAVLGYAALASDLDEIVQIKDYLSKIKLAGNLLLTLINDTLDLSKIESGAVTLKPSPIGCGEVISRVVAAVRPEIDRKHIKFNIDNSRAVMAVINVDSMRVQEIIINLLSNAVKFTPEHGEISLVVECVKLEKDCVHDRITIRDNGCGMSKEFLNRLFEPFSQERTRENSKVTGSGLGLSIVKQLVELMGGTIEVKSELGKGTEFIINLDFERADESLAESGDAVQASGSLKDKRILMCEDNDMNREIAEKLLEFRGAKVTSAENGSVGVELFNKSEPYYFDAILMDVRMPIMDGYEATKTIRSMDRPDALSIPIIAMSADAYDDDVRKCISSGMNGHIAKPIDPEKLYGAILAL